MPLHLEIVTAERVVLTDEVDQVNAPTRDGRMGILPRHMPVLTLLEPGELDIIKNGEVTPFAVTGGFLEVLPNRVTVLADTALRADEIDEARADEARRRAEEMLRQSTSARDVALAESELRRALVELKVAGLKKIRRQ
jgi:F-type H+-transporting ATPase subunit epsilon